MRTKRPFAISRGTTDRFENLVLRAEIDGETGWGEACPSRSVTGETIATAAATLAEWSRRPEGLAAVNEATMFTPGGHDAPAARSAAVCAILDAQGRRNGRPMRSLLNLPEGELRSSITLSLGTPGSVMEEARLRADEGWTIFKVKLGNEHDEAVVKGLRDSFPAVTLRVDANEAWSPLVAAARLPFLERMEVEFVEQPLPRALDRDTAELARRFEIPIILDESVRTADEAVAAIAHDVADGVNVKLAKCGGPYEARRMLKILRDHGWRTMMGCNLESSLGNAAAAAFAGALDFADIDSHELLADDPWTGWSTPGGRVSTPDAPGAGLALRDADRLLALTAGPDRPAAAL